MTPVEAIAFNYQRTHGRALSAVEGLSNEQLAWRASTSAPSIGFHIWHMARWADGLLEAVNGPGSQLWEKERLAVHWGFIPATLGHGETGMGMGDDASAHLPLPGKDAILDYVRRAFAAADQAVHAIDEQRFQEPRTWEGSERTLGFIVTSALTHETTGTLG